MFVVTDTGLTETLQLWIRDVTMGLKFDKGAGGGTDG